MTNDPILALFYRTPAQLRADHIAEARQWIESAAFARRMGRSDLAASFLATAAQERLMAMFYR